MANPSDTTQHTVIPDRQQPAPSRRTTLVLLALATAIGSLGLAAGGTAGALIATGITGNPAVAGLPLGAAVTGSAVGALTISFWTSRAGRVGGLILGYAGGALGAVVVIAATVAQDLALVLAGSTALGAANAALFLTRYAAADAGGPALRGRALGTILFAAAVGAVVSPNLLGPSGEMAVALGLPRLSGLYLVAVPSFALAGLTLFAASRVSAPSLRRVAQRAPTGIAVQQRDSSARSNFVAGLRETPVRIALLILAAANLIMVAIMAVAPVHLTAHGHGLEFIGLTISIHVLGMFAPSPLSGWLADRAGGATVGAIGAALLVAAGLTGMLVDPENGVGFTLVLVLLGLGWNGGVVGGSTLLAASAPPALRPHVEGVGEIAMGLAAAVGAPVAGMVVALGSFTALALFGLVAGAMVLFAALWRMRAVTGGTAPQLSSKG